MSQPLVLKHKAVNNNGNNGNNNDNAQNWVHYVSKLRPPAYNMVILS
jgi:hypothetical protein